MLAIVQALKEWRHYLLGASKCFEVWTDHANLTYFRSPQKLNRRQARWRLDLSEYDFVLVHKPGKRMGKPDLISRRADFDRGDKDNNDVVFLKEEWLMRGVVVTERDELVTKVKEAQKRVKEGD